MSRSSYATLKWHITFKLEVRKIIVDLGGELTTIKERFEYKIPTTQGVLMITPYNNWIGCQFEGSIRKITFEDNKINEKTFPSLIERFRKQLKELIGNNQIKPERKKLTTQCKFCSFIDIKPHMDICPICMKPQKEPKPKKNVSDVPFH